MTSSTRHPAILPDVGERPPGIPVTIPRRLALIALLVLVAAISSSITALLLTTSHHPAQQPQHAGAGPAARCAPTHPGSYQLI